MQYDSPVQLSNVFTDIVSTSALDIYNIWLFVCTRYLPEIQNIAIMNQYMNQGRELQHINIFTTIFKVIIFWMIVHVATYFDDRTMFIFLVAAIVLILVCVISYLAMILINLRQEMVKNMLKLANDTGRALADITQITITQGQNVSRQGVARHSQILLKQNDSLVKLISNVTQLDESVRHLQGNSAEDQASHARALKLNTQVMLRLIEELQKHEGTPLQSNISEIRKSLELLHTDYSNLNENMRRIGNYNSRNYDRIQQIRAELSLLRRHIKSIYKQLKTEIN